MSGWLERLSPNIRGAIFMVVAMAGFSSNDSMMKLLGRDLDLYQAIFLRGVVVTAIFGIATLAVGAMHPIRGRHDHRALAGRTLGEIAGAFCFLTALMHMPLANATAILQSLPLTITLAAAYLLGEPVGWRRYTAICVGFAGVVVIVRPGAEGFNAYSILIVISVLFFTLRDLATRMISAEVPTALAAFVTSALTTLAAGAVSVFTGWRAVSAINVLEIAIGSACLVVGYAFSILAMRTGEVAVVAPFRYVLLLWAMILGFLIYGDIPDRWMLAGAAIVVGTGLYTFHRERRAARPVPPIREIAGRRVS